MARDRRRTAETTSLSVEDAHRHAEKAGEFLRVAEQALEDGNRDAAGANAVFATVHAADAISGFLQGNRWSGPHDQAAAHVQRAGREGRHAAKELRRVLPKRTAVEYSAAGLGATTINEMLQAARRAVSVASRVAERH